MVVVIVVVEEEKESRRGKETIVRLTDDQKEGRGGREREEQITTTATIAPTPAKASGLHQHLRSLSSSRVRCRQSRRRFTLAVRHHDGGRVIIRKIFQEPAVVRVTAICGAGPNYQNCSRHTSILGSLRCLTNSLCNPGVYRLERHPQPTVGAFSPQLAFKAELLRPFLCENRPAYRLGRCVLRWP